jgi:hypothetical protein
VPDDFTIELADGTTVGARHYPAANPSAAVARLVLAHGAGAGQTHPFMVGFAGGLAERGVDVVTFNFPYMEARRRVPNPAPVLERCYLRAIAAARGLAPRGAPAAATPAPDRVAPALFIGGKSLGGRIASHVAARRAEEAGNLAGLVCLGYPLHPPGRPDERRDAHLGQVAIPMLFVQGSRDAFGTPDELGPVLRAIGPRAELFIVEHGDHSFVVPRSRSTSTAPRRGAREAAAASQAAVHARVQDAIVAWMRRVMAS